MENENNFQKAPWSLSLESEILDDNGNIVCDMVSLDEKEHIASAILIVRAPELHDLVKKLSTELYQAVGFINDNLAEQNKTKMKKDKCAYMSMKTIQEADLLLDRIRGK